MGQTVLLVHGAQDLLDREAGDLERVGEMDVVFDVVVSDILQRSTALVRPGGTLVTISSPPALPDDGLTQRRQQNGRSIRRVSITRVD